MPKQLGLILFCLLFLNSASHAQDIPASIVVGNFTAGQLKDWEAKLFKDETVYSIESDSELHINVLKAKAHASASGLFRKLNIDLTKTPFINWSWKVENIFTGTDENSKSGDDFPARIYVVTERGLMGFDSISLNYVWASQHSAQSIWTSPFTNNVMLFAADSGTLNLHKWISHKRNIRDDLRKAFGIDIREINVAALMTDTDNHGGDAVAYYGNIWFSAN